MRVAERGWSKTGGTADPGSRLVLRTVRERAGWAIERGLWSNAYRELLRPRSVAVALASVALFVLLMTTIGPLGTMETLRPLLRFAYWGLSAAVTFPLCYAVAAVVLYLTRLGSLVEMVPAVMAAVLFEGLVCMAVVLAADMLFLPPASKPLSPLHTYLTVTVVVGACTFFAHYVVFLRISHGLAAAAERSARGRDLRSGGRDAAPVAPSEARTAAAAAGSVTTTSGNATPFRSGSPRGATPPIRSARDLGTVGAAGTAAPAPRAVVPARRPSPVRGKLAAQQARFHDRLSHTVSRDIIYLKMDDHYVNVRTTGGSCLVLMRFADAVAELGTHGMQVHRSYWVAYRHMLATTRRDGRPMVRVTGGYSVPISRPNLPAVRDELRSKPPAPEGVRKLPR